MAHNVDYAIASRCDKICVCTSSGASEAYPSKRARAGMQARRDKPLSSTLP